MSEQIHGISTKYHEHGGSTYKPIENYGVIGDLHTVALVGRDGSIDWCCLPHFDSPSVFGAILDAQKGGYFRIFPMDEAVNKQMYLPETCVLVTRFLSPDGVGEVVDFMPIDERSTEEIHTHQIVRQVRVVRGTVRFRMECVPAFDYAREPHIIERLSHGVVFTAGKKRLGLTSPVKLVSYGMSDGKGVAAEWVMHAGEEFTFVLRYMDQPEENDIVAPKFDGMQAFDKTVRYWRHWLNGCNYSGRWREMVQRSALTLKLLTFRPTGAIVAAPTCSLPEEIGGVRNWDYRYTWIRDAAFTTYAFLRLGLTREAEAFMNWIDARAQEEGEDGSLQIMYGIRGKHDLNELVLDHLEGYRQSVPVRIGNGAHNQLQMDIYGELMDAVYLSNKHSKPISSSLWKHLRRSLNYVCDNWHRKDEGIWEVRSGRQHFVYSKLMCWVALDRGLRLAYKRSFPGDPQRWQQERDKIYEEIMEKGWSEERNSFVQHYDTQALDASNLIMPLSFFISPTDPKMLGTLEATLSTLVSDSLVHRYQNDMGTGDGLEGTEGTFSMCTFWLVECLTRAGRLDEARLTFEKMLTYANHVGLYAEEIGQSGEALGNFPQAFTHLGLISAAYNLNEALDK